MVSPDKNERTMVMFIFLGFSEYPELQVPLFLLFLKIYAVSVVESMGMVVVIMSIQNSTAMYFFLNHSSFLNFCFSIVVKPKLLENIVVQDRSISINVCVTQFSIGFTFLMTEMVILEVMAYDYFVDICYPLLYTVSIYPKLCSMLVIVAFTRGIISSIVLSYSIPVLSFCETKIINNFQCEYSFFLSASCSDKQFIEIILFIFANLNAFCTLIIVLISYLFIFVIILKIDSESGIYKAFSTCTYHLMAVTIYYGTTIFLYFIPNSKTSLIMVKVGSVFILL
ncbi:olfactory receptor 1165-like [Notamacropus eugenii]|uniref:olfactory receptor 1165-like n=1 Tax=Notamacropus eugenii TaxID=9315 RepID=UPI003B670627